MQNKNLRGASWLCLTFIMSLALAVSSCGSRSQYTEPAEGFPVSELIGNADKMYEQREDLARVREGIALLRRVRTVSAHDYEAAWRLARLSYYLGSQTKDEKERDDAFREGVQAGEDAARWQDGRPEGHFWLGANMGGRAQNNPLGGVADAEDIRKEMKKVITLDEDYEFGSAYMVLGQVDLELPRLMGGDPQEAVKNLETGLRYGENNSLLRLHLAEAYLATGRKDDARKQLDTLLKMQPNPSYVPEHKQATEEARKLLETKLK